MKLCRYDDDRLGVVVGDMVHDVTAAQDEIRAAAPYTMRGDAVIAALPEWRGRLEDMASKAPGKPVSEVSLLCPVARPSKVMAAPVNYHAHHAEMQADSAIPKNRPKGSGIGDQGIFLKANSALVGASEGVSLRFPDRRSDQEVEFVIIIGKQGTDISQDDALDYIAGYTLGLDMSLRGPEDRSFRKSIDGHAPLGPYFVTADEIPDPDDVRFKGLVNDELRQDAHTKDLIYGIRRLIEFATSFYTIYPGDVYFTGSPAGVGQVYPGDVIRAECNLIGTMDVPVHAHQ
jgi:2-keto-4-pentenoate hydratase/2-oxohepta-3-ene-1,7-dioic acid hydratase in catechol pathway